jgi:hypothetical protein
VLDNIQTISEEKFSKTLIMLTFGYGVKKSTEKWEFCNVENKPLPHFSETIARQKMLPQNFTKIIVVRRRY